MATPAEKKRIEDAFVAYLAVDPSRLRTLDGGGPGSRVSYVILFDLFGETAGKLYRQDTNT